MNITPRSVIFITFTASLLPLLPARGEGILLPGDPRIGCWRNVEDETSFLRIETDKITFARSGCLRIGTLHDAHESNLAFLLMGSWSSLSTVCKHGVLITKKEGTTRNREEKHVFCRMDAWLEELELTVHAFPHPEGLLSDEKENIQKALRIMEEESLPTEASTGEPGSIPESNAANGKSLKKIVQRVGWIDAERFGFEASAAAVRMGYRSEDVGLMLGALPFIEKDVAAKRFADPEVFAVFYDRLQLLLGKPQKYGTQTERMDGKRLVLVLEDPARVDEYRRQIGLKALVQDEIRSNWKASDVKAKTFRYKVRKAVIVMDASAASKGKGILDKFKKAFGDPAAESEAIDELEGMGKDGVVAALNFMTTDINHLSEDGAQMGSAIFGFITRKSLELWSIGNEFNYGVFESSEEKWNAITEMKLKILEKDKAYKIKE